MLHFFSVCTNLYLTKEGERSRLPENLFVLNDEPGELLSSQKKRHQVDF